MYLKAATAPPHSKGTVETDMGRTCDIQLHPLECFIIFCERSIRDEYSKREDFDGVGMFRPGFGIGRIGHWVKLVGAGSGGAEGMAVIVGSFEDVGGLGRAGGE